MEKRITWNVILKIIFTISQQQLFYILSFDDHLNIPDFVSESKLKQFGNWNNKVRRIFFIQNATPILISNFD